MKMENGKWKVENGKMAAAALILSFQFSIFNSSAAVTLDWDVETTRAEPATFYEWQGAEYDLKAAFKRNGKPLQLDIPDDVQPRLYWQTNGMDYLYWEVPASISQIPTMYGTQTVFRAKWKPDYETGNASYNCFIGVKGMSYNAAFQLRLRKSPGADPNALPLPVPTLDFAKVKVLNPPFGPSCPRILPKYLHSVRYSDSYPEEARMYYDWAYGKCSSMRDGGFHSRNYDWDFDKSCMFVTLMEPSDRRHGSVGVSGVGTNLTEEIVSRGEWSRWYKALPGHTLDGVNDAGVAVNINVVSSHGHTNGWHALSSDTNAIHALGAVRWVLDNADGAKFAATSLAERVWVPQKMLDAGYSVHYMISDAAETWIAEEGVARLVSRGGRVAMTNFRLLDKLDGILDPYGTGYERYDILMDGGDITNAWFTKAYEYDTEPRRYSEFVSPDVPDVTNAWNAAAAAWAKRPREEHRGEPLPGGEHWWQSVHTSVYDLTNRTLRVAAQENDEWYVFGIPGGGGGANPDKVKEIIAKTYVGDYPEPENDSVLERVTNADVGLCVTNGVLMVIDGTNVVWESESASVTNQFNSLKQIVYTWEGFLDGSNVVFAITNYLSGSYNLDEAKLRIKELRDLGGGVKEYVTVYNSRDEIVLHLTNFNAKVVQPGFTNLANRITSTSNWVESAKAPKSWGDYASDGLPAPSNTVVIRASSTVFAGGHAFERINIGSGSIGILVSKGAAAFTGEPGTFRFRDAITGEYFGYVKNTYTLGVDTSGISTTNAENTVTLTYNITMSEGNYPIIMYLPDLDDYDPDEWVAISDMNGDPIPPLPPGVLGIAWEDSSGTPGQRICHINVGTTPKGFFTATVGGIKGSSIFETNMAAMLLGGIVADDSENPDIKYQVRPFVVGTNVIFRVESVLP